MFDLIATVLAWFYSLVPNYAVAIALLTLSVMVLLTPLTLKATKSMLQMQKLQPELKRIQQEYKGDRQKMNEELMKFYQANKINPLGGCLPLLLQAPVFFVLYRVLHKLTEPCTAEHIADKATRCFLDSDLTQPVTVGNFGPSYLDKSTDLFQSLASTDQMMAFGLDLSHSAVRELGNSFVSGLPYLVLVIVVAATSYVQQWQITVRSRNQNQPINPQQQMLLRILPAFFAVISLTLPAGLVVYFLVSNCYRILQQFYITQRFYKRQSGTAPGGAEGAGATPKASAAKPAPTKQLPAKTTPAKSQAAPKATPPARSTPKPTPKSSGKPTPTARPKPLPGSARPSPRQTPPKKKK